jgi:hypothetical protein
LWLRRFSHSDGQKSRVIHDGLLESPPFVAQQILRALYLQHDEVILPTKTHRFALTFGL